MHVLVVEDDQVMAEEIAVSLTENGHTVRCAHSGAQALAEMSAGLGESGGENAGREAGFGPPDAVVLDRMLPGVNGLDVLRTWRGAGNRVPVLVLTALDAIDSRIEGLDCGADDYMCKPFAMSELVARLNALHRRAGAASEVPATRLQAGPLEIDLLRREAIVGDQIVSLQPRELRLLEELVRNKGEAVTRTMLLESVWGLHFDPQTNIVETHMSRLRSKLAACGVNGFIHTVRGVGYRIDAV
ncbi:response regulator transcription factor [Novosphingobium sp. 1949]|uniref:Response regulator transcription factor n=1 Tax=Novosphingobium organovorum TaxID=2930092 RepID=A0ABT0BFV8_9SPHN|nr:response regulator transcription factor [Novosphingobium organovorum]MCJ2183957.1 response regulator transcription factor [Novosphingobium organovorum]